MLTKIHDGCYVDPSQVIAVVPTCRIGHDFDNILWDVHVHINDGTDVNLALRIPCESEAAARAKADGIALALQQN